VRPLVYLWKLLTYPCLMGMGLFLSLGVGETRDSMWTPCRLVSTTVEPVWDTVADSGMYYMYFEVI
jgi:hypothetical protein